MKMYDTPDKGTIGKTSSLREKIESKLMTEKKLLNTK